jgi:hypothetical protein
MKNTFIYSLLILLVACGVPKKEEEEDVTVFRSCSTDMETSGECMRFMDRNLYFAFASGDKNNVFDKDKVKDSLNEVAARTGLGFNYFNFLEVDSSQLEIPVEKTSSSTSFKSHIQIWPDADFNVLWTSYGSLADPNTILLVNHANKRQWMLIIRSACLESDNVLCSNDAGADFTANKGLSALIARQLGLLVAMTIKDCSTAPENVMCATTPSDTQWSVDNSEQWEQAFNNSLDTIGSNPNFYAQIFLDQ